MTDVKHESGLCVETRTVGTSRHSETFPCTKQAKTTVIAAGGGHGLVPNGRQFPEPIHRQYDRTPEWQAGDTLHVCGQHRGVHERRHAKAEAYESKRSAGEHARKDVEKFLTDRGITGGCYYSWRTGEYERSAVIPLEELERLLP